jgi:NADPH:quinone reductase-like Zn-dependent oxidoreductase
VTGRRREEIAMSYPDTGRSEVPPTSRVLWLLAPGIEGLNLAERPTPVPDAGEVLVRVHAAALTRDELEWPVDRLPAVPSYELSGVVASVGDGVVTVAPGDAVFALTPFDRDGGAADFAPVPAAVLAARPAALDDLHAACIALPGLSAWQGLFDHGTLEKGQRVLILGASGGVGQFATQLAALHGAFVIGTASSAGRDLAVELGANQVLDRSDGAGIDALEPVDLVFDTVGGDLVNRAGARVRPGGRLVSIAAEPPAPADSSVATAYFVVEPNRAQLVELGRLAHSGDLRVVLDSVHPLPQAREAFARVQAPGKRGKVVLRVADL